MSVALVWLGTMILAYWLGWSDSKLNEESKRAFEALDRAIEKMREP